MFEWSGSCAYRMREPLNYVRLNWCERRRNLIYFLFRSVARGSYDVLWSNFCALSIRWSRYWNLAFFPPFDVAFESLGCWHKYVRKWRASCRRLCDGSYELTRVSILIFAGIMSSYAIFTPFSFRFQFYRRSLTITWQFCNMERVVTAVLRHVIPDLKKSWLGRFVSSSWITLSYFCSYRSLRFGEKSSTAIKVKNFVVTVRIYRNARLSSAQ
jgi:hypothetical protein